MLRSLTILSLLAVLLGIPATAEPRGLSAWTRSFLDSYVKADAKAVLRSVDDNTTVYGSDAAEVFHGRAAIESMLADDTRLWRGSARIGEMRHVSLGHGGKLQTIFFDADFAVGRQPPVPVRFCMVWRKSKEGWLLVQSSNAVLTEGQSAQAILKGNVP